jgi:hypothetical protein
VVAKVRPSAAVQKFDVERFNLKMVNDVEVKNSIRSKSEIGLQLWKTSYDDVDISRAWESWNIKVSAMREL